MNAQKLTFAKSYSLQHSTNQRTSKRDLLYAFLKHEHRAEFTNIQTFLYPRGDEGFRFTAKTTKMHTLYEAIFKLEEVSHHFASSGFRNSWPADCRMYNASSDIGAERISFFTSDQQCTTSIHKEANRPPPTSYSTAAVPQQQKQTEVSQARPKPVQNQNNNQPCEQFANMCTNVSLLCKQTCEAIQQQQPILAAILTQLDEQRQETKLICQENKSLQQQVISSPEHSTTSSLMNTIMILFQKTTPTMTATSDWSALSTPEQLKNQKR